MIRTGYLRWEIDVIDARAAADPQAREVSFRARPTYRLVRVRDAAAGRAAEDRFALGAASYDEVLQARAPPPQSRM